MGQPALATTDGRTWVLSGLDVSTSLPGRYVLTLKVGGSGITDTFGNELASGTSAAWTVIPPYGSMRRVSLFYNNSAGDGNDPAANTADQGAIAPEKQPVWELADGTRVFPPHVAGQIAPNISSYSRGINGIIIDLDRLPTDVTLTADDFDFGTSNVPSTVTVRSTGLTVFNPGSRVTLTWDDYDPFVDTPHEAVGNGWLRVTVKANSNTRLPVPVTFSFANLIGDVNGDGRVSAFDYALFRRQFGREDAVPGSDARLADFNQDGRVNVADYGIFRQGFGRALPEGLPVTLALVESSEPIRPSLRRRASVSGDLLGLDESASER